MPVLSVQARSRRPSAALLLSVHVFRCRDASLKCTGTLSTAVSGAEWRPHVRKTRGVVQPNEEMVARVEASVARGTAEFHVVCELQGKPEWCELQVDRRGARLRCLHGLSSLLALVGQGAISAASRLPISAASRLHLGRISAAHLGCISARPQLNLGCQGDGRKSLAWRDADSSCASFYPPSPADAASVVLPSELLQVRLRGKDGAEVVVQADSPFMRDSIVLVARRFAAVNLGTAA